MLGNWDAFFRLPASHIFSPCSFHTDHGHTLCSCWSFSCLLFPGEVTSGLFSWLFCTDWPAASLLFSFSHLQQTDCLLLFFFLMFFKYSWFGCSRQYLILCSLKVDEDSSFSICLSECPRTKKMNLIWECWCKKHECNFLKFCMRHVGATTYLSYPANFIS